jgi:hypothetical protein
MGGLQLALQLSSHRAPVEIIIRGEEGGRSSLLENMSSLFSSCFLFSLLILSKQSKRYGLMEKCIILHLLVMQFITWDFLSIIT